MSINEILTNIASHGYHFEAKGFGLVREIDFNPRKKAINANEVLPDPTVLQ